MTYKPELPLEDAQAGLVNKQACGVRAELANVEPQGQVSVH